MKMFRFVVLILLTVVYVEALSDRQLDTLKEAVDEFEEAKNQTAEATTQLEEDETKEKEYSYRVWKDTRQLKKDTKQEEESRQNLEEVIKDTMEMEMERVNVTYSNMSSNGTDRWGRSCGAECVTDGDLWSESRTDMEPEPYYSAEIDERFTAIRLNITLREVFKTTYTVYTLDEGVETLCATRDPESLDEREARYPVTWTVVCHNYAGYGFKISASTTWRYNPLYGNTWLILNEVTVDIKEAEYL